jgi:phenylalanyl-tRNA synthetase beta chain
VLAAVLESVRVPWRVEAAREPFLHPGRSAAVLAGDEPVGWLGELHPTVAGEWELEETVAAFEVDLDRVLAHAVRVPEYEDVTAFPSVLRDLALTMDESIPAGAVVATVRAAAGALLRSVDVFDVYAGEQVGPERKSIALHLEFRAPDRTLTDEDASELVTRIIRRASEELGAAHRA